MSVHPRYYYETSAHEFSTDSKTSDGIWVAQTTALEGFLVYDRKKSNSTPIAFCWDVDVVEKLVNALNEDDDQ